MVFWNNFSKILSTNIAVIAMNLASTQKHWLTDSTLRCPAALWSSFRLHRWELWRAIFIRTTLSVRCYTQKFTKHSSHGNQYTFTSSRVFVSNYPSRHTSAQCARASYNEHTCVYLRGFSTIFITTCSNARNSFWLLAIWKDWKLAVKLVEWLIWNQLCHLYKTLEPVYYGPKSHYMVPSVVCVCHFI